MRHATTLYATSQQLAGGLGIAAATVAIRVGIPLGALISSHPGRSEPYHIAFFSSPAWQSQRRRVSSG